MENFVTSFVSLIKDVAVYDILWIFGMRAYMFVRDAITGRNARL